MPAVYRLIKTRHANTAFDGYGARTHGGRWNSKGGAACYASDSIALAVLEVLVHLRDTEILESYTLCTLELPDEEIMVLDPSALPEDWQGDPAPLSTAAIGDGWLAGGDGLALAIPSIIIPAQWNYLLNPAHPEYARLVAASQQCEPFRFDGRLLSMASAGEGSGR
jgi:RES domain-containing protein